MNIEKDKFQKCELVYRIFEGDVSPEEFQFFEKSLHQDIELLRIYSQIAEIYGHFICPGLSLDLQHSSPATDNAALDMKLWELLLEEERSAPAIEIPDKQQQQELTQKVVYPPKEKRKLSRFNLFTLVMSAAAMLMLITYVKLNPIQTPYQIAVLSDSLNAKWSYPVMEYKSGDPIYTNELIELTDGFAEFTLENGVKLVAEGPVRLEFEDTMQVFLEQGKLTAKVTPGAKGFTIRTNTATIVDYGTEFGVISDPYRTEAHVFSGKVDFRAGSDVRYYEKSMRLETGQAAVSNDNGIQKIEVRSKDFYKNVPTQYELYIHQLKPSFYSHAAEPDRVVSIYTPDAQSVIDGSVRCARRLSLDRQPHEYAWEIDGSQGGIQFSEIEIPEESFTAVFWSKPDVVQGFQTIFASRHLLADGDIFYRHITLDDSGRLIQYYINDKGENTIVKSIPIVIQSTTAIETGQWCHVALIYDGLRKRKTLMINGAVSNIEMSSYEAKQSNCTGIYLGGSYPGQLRMFEKDVPFSGKVSDVLYFNRAIAPEYVTQLYKTSLQKKLK